MAVQIRGGQIKSATITGANLATGAINNSNLFGAGVIASAALAADCVVSSKIADGAIDTTAFLANDVVTAAKIDKSGTFDFSGGTVSVASPTADAHAATKAYVDNLQSGVHWKESAIVASTANVDLASAPSSIDGVTLSADDRVLIKDQSTASQNGVYVWASAGAAMTRASDCDSASELNGMAIFVQQGTVADMGFVQTEQIDTLGSDSVSYTQFTGLGQITAGNGLSKTSNTLSVDLSSNSGLEFSSGELQINDGNGLELSGGVLQAKLDGSTLSLSASGLKVGTVTSSELGANSVTSNAIADGSIDSSAYFSAGVVDGSAIASNAISAAKISSSAVTTAKINNAAVDETKLASSVAGDGLSGGAGSALAVSVDDSTIEISSDSLRLKDSGISAAKMASNSIATASVQDDAITAAKIGAAFYQEGFQISGSSTSTLDLSRAIDSGFFNGVMVFKNGIALHNMTAMGDTPADNDEFTIANNGSGGVARITLGAAADNNDGLVCVYFT